MSTTPLQTVQQNLPAGVPLPPYRGNPWDDALQSVVTPDDPQRRATALERVLDVVGIPNYAMAGLAQSALHGEDPFQGVARGIANRTTFGQVLKDQGLNGPLASVLGFGLDVATDPLTYTGIGELTEAGRAARLAETGLEAAQLAGDTARETAMQAMVQQAGKLGVTWGEQGALGQRSLLQFMGQNLVPAPVNSRIFSLADQVAQRFGESRIGQSLNEAFTTAASRVPAALQVANWGRNAGAANMTRESVETLVRPFQREVQTLADDAGIEYKTAANVVAFAVQHSKPPEAINPAVYLRGNELARFQQLSAESERLAATGAEIPTELQNERQQLVTLAQGRAASERVLDAVHQGKQSFGVPDLDDQPLVKSVNAINTANATFITNERQAGLKISELVGWQQYLKRALTPEARRAMQEANPAFAGLGPREFTTQFGAMIQRDPELRDLTINQINDLARAGKLKALGGRSVPEFFFEDPFVATALRADESARAIGTAQFLKSAARVYGQQVNVAAGQEIPAGWQTLSTRLADELGLRLKDQTTGELVRDTAFPAEVAKLLDSHYERILNPKWLEPFMDALYKTNAIWRAWTLPVWPTYHARNFVNDLWMITAIPGGMPLWRLPERTAQSIAALRGSTDAIRLGGSEMTLDQVRSLAEGMGLIHAGVERDLADLVRKPLMAERHGIDKLVDNGFIQKAMAVGEARENSTKLAYFIDRLARGEPPEVAALEVRKRLWNYGDLTAFERQILRPIFPFYSWARANVPHQIQWLFHYPGYAALTNKIRSETTLGMTGQPDIGGGQGPLPQFLAQGQPLPFGENEWGQPIYARTQSLNPVSDVEQVLTPMGAANAVLDQASPFLKVPFEVGMRYDLFRNKPSEDYPFQMQNLLGAPFPQRYYPLAELARPVTELDRLNPGGVFGNQFEPGWGGIPRTGPDVNWKGKAMSLLLARTYAQDPGKIMRQEQRAQEARLRDLRYQYGLALSRGDTVNADLIQHEMERVIATPDRALGTRR
jgi:hypothetical protein